MEALIIVLLLALIGAVVAAGWLLISQRRRPAEEPTEAQRMEQQLASLRSDLTQALQSSQQALVQHVSSVDSRLNQRLDSVDNRVGQRLDAVQTDINRSMTSANETIGKIGEQLGELGQSAKRIMEVGQDVSSLKDVLQPPKLRGNFGEMLLEQLVGQVLPDAYYSRQYRFSDGSMADLVIRTPEGLVPIDAKFPVDTFRRMLAATTDDDRLRERRVFLREVKSRIEQCAKYIRPEDNTLDFALMYVPAENIYYEAIAGTAEESAMTFALERRVHLVSPNTFHAFLQVVVRGFRGLQVEQNAQQIMARLGQLQHEFSRFRHEFEILGTHVGRAKNKYDELDKLAGRLGDRLEIPVQGRLLDVDAQTATLDGALDLEPQLPKPTTANGSDEG